MGSGQHRCVYAMAMTMLWCLSSVAGASSDVMAWGYNAQGELGLGHTTTRSTPAQLPDLTNAQALACGAFHSLALLEDATIQVWGYNANGELGLGDTTNRLSPTPIPGAAHVRQVAGGALFTLVLFSNGTVQACGINDYGQLGQGDTTNRHILTPIPALTGITAIACGRGQCLALHSNGQVYAWGANLYGQLGLSNNTDVLSPTAIPGLSNVTAVACGAWHSMALLADHTLMAWGENGYGELGLGDVTDRNTPVAVPGLAGVASIHCGGWHNMALMQDGSVQTWGYNYHGQLGLGDLFTRYSPTPLTRLTNVLSMACGNMHNTALTQDGTVQSWGYNGYGQLGLGDTYTRWIPVTVSSLSNIAILAAGERHTLALTGPDFIISGIRFSEDTLWRDEEGALPGDAPPPRGERTSREHAAHRVDPLYEDTTFTAYVTVSNRGPTAGDAGTLSIWANHPAGVSAPATGDQEQAVGILDAGGAREMTFAGLHAPDHDGSYIFRALADSRNLTRESNEANNSATKPYPVQSFFSLQPKATGMTLWWYTPTVLGLTNAEVMIRWSLTEFPSGTGSGTLLYAGTNTTYNHTNLTPDQSVYYRIWVKEDGSGAYIDPPGVTNQRTAKPHLMPIQILMRCSDTFTQGGKEKTACRVFLFSDEETGRIDTNNIPASFNLRTRWSFVASGNFNPAMPGDEALIRDSSGNLYLLYFKHTGALDWDSDNTNSVYWTSYTPGTNYSTNAAAWIIDAAGDVNGDGRDEIIARNSETFTEGGKTKSWTRTLFFADDGSGVLASTQPDAFKFATLWTIEGLGRFNTHAVNSSSNAQQLLLRHANDGGFYLLYMDDNGAIYWNDSDTNDICWTSWTPGASFSTNATDWEVSAIGDINGDAQDEIFLTCRHTYTQNTKTKSDRRILFFSPDGTGQLKTNQPATFSFSTVWAPLGLGNFNTTNINGAAQSDQLLLRHTDNAALCLLYFNADGTLAWDLDDTNSIYHTSFTLADEYATNALNWSLQAISDFTGTR
ncbi:MAG: hypothetical protein EOM20_14490 [Spartobacteria bacterium]|nr:hypothetical protein [Spartobacteria bacterium]